jgi:hypothetical protein
MALSVLWRAVDFAAEYAALTQRLRWAGALEDCTWSVAIKQMRRIRPPADLYVVSLPADRVVLVHLPVRASTSGGGGAGVVPASGAGEAVSSASAEAVEAVLEGDAAWLSIIQRSNPEYKLESSHRIEGASLTLGGVRVRLGIAVTGSATRGIIVELTAPADCAHLINRILWQMHGEPANCSEYALPPACTVVRPPPELVRPDLLAAVSPASARLRVEAVTYCAAFRAVGAVVTVATAGAGAASAAAALHAPQPHAPSASWP